MCPLFLGRPQVILDDDDVAVAAITIAELGVGVEPSNGKIRALRQRLLDEVLAEIPALDYDIDAAHFHAQLLGAVRHQGRPRGAHDLIIAATALSSARVVVSADRTAFIDLPGVSLLTYR